MKIQIPLAVAAISTLPLVANAAEEDRLSGNDIVLEIGGGGVYKPKYEGASNYILSPYPLFKLHFLRLPNGYEIGGGTDQGFGFRPAFGYRGERQPSDAPILAGLGTVSSAFEFGAAVSYRMDYLEGFLELRRGFGGHEGWVGETGVDVIFNPTDRMEISGGPRASFASSDYMQTYFGVTAAQSAASGLPTTSVGSGFKTVGIEGEVRYKLTDKVTAVTGASWERLIGDAGSSPIITGGGKKNQFSVRLGLTYKFGAKLY